MRLALAQQHQAEFFRLKQQHDGTAHAAAAAPNSSVTTALEPGTDSSEVRRDYHLSSSSSGFVGGAQSPSLSPPRLLGIGLKNASLPQPSTPDAEFELVAESSATSSQPVLDHEDSWLDADSVVPEPPASASASGSAPPPSSQVLQEASVSHLVSLSPSSSSSSASEAASLPLQHCIAATSDSALISNSTLVPLAAVAMHREATASSFLCESVDREPIFDAKST
jgi:hypothetical protein